MNGRRARATRRTDDRTGGGALRALGTRRLKCRRGTPIHLETDASAPRHETGAPPGAPEPRSRRGTAALDLLLGGPLAGWAIRHAPPTLGRGPHPVFWALWEGTPAGATLHEVAAAVAGGPIVEQREVAVLSSDTGGRLQERVEGAQRELFSRWLPRLAAGERPPARPQPDGGTFHPLAEFEFMRDEGGYEVPRGERERLERCLTVSRAAHADGVARAAAQE